MGVDPLSPIAPVRLRSLLLPVGKIKRSRFLDFAARLQAENVVRLGDVSPDARPNRNLFSPLAFPTGMILYDLDISVPPTSHLDLFPFEIFREPLAIIAIADGTELHGYLGEDGLPSSETPTGTLSETQAQPSGLDKLLDELSVLKDHYPKSLVHQLVIFDHAGVDKPISKPENVIWVPSREKSRSTTMKTVMCDISSLVLGELDDFARTMQSLPAIDSPRASSWGPRRTPDARDKRMTMPAQLPSRPNGVPDQTPTPDTNGTSTPRGHESPTTFDEITRSIQLANRASAALKPVSAPGSKEHSRERKSVQGLGSMSASDRTKNRIKGRLNIVIGSLFLQAGRWPDALKDLVEGAGIARASSDYVWHAKALEYILLCLLMLGWAGMDFQIPQICYPIADKSSSKSSTPTPSTPDNSGPNQSTPTNRLVSLQNLTNLLPDLSNNILNLYTRASHITDEPVPQLIFSETVVRLARLLSTVHVRDGAIDDQSLKHIVTGEPLVPLSNPERPRGTVILRKTDIATFLYRALPLSPAADVPVTDLIPIYAGMASVLSALGLQRRKVFILKELLAVLVPGLVQARKIGAAEIGIHPAAGLSALSNTTFAINALDIGPGNMEESMRSLLDLVSEAFGVHGSADLGSEQRRPSTASGQNSRYDSIDAIVERALRYSVLKSFGDLDLKVEILKCCINFCEALPDFHGVLKFTVELLQTIRGVLMLAPDNSRAFPSTPALPREEQIRLFNNIKRTVGATNKLGLSGLEAEYWDDFLVRGVEAIDMPGLKKPVQRSRREFNAAATTEDGAKRSPFIYNPFTKTSTKLLESLMVAGEPASFKVTLQNPYEFEIEIESIRLEGEGVPLKAAAYDVWIAPFSLQEIVVSGVAEGEGLLKLSYCIVKVRHCRERRFPIFKKPWKPQLETKIKRTGLAAKENPPERPTSWDSTVSTNGKPVVQKGPEADPCMVKVIEAQPTVVIQSTSLSQSAIMVLEGETTSFTISLRNTSNCPADMILFTFQDSTTRQIQTALSNRDIIPTELYELELQLSKKPALKWRREGADSKNPSIAAGETATFTIEVLGKPGLHDAVVQIDYSYVGVSHTELPDTFFTRQIQLPLTVTVNASIEVSRCDLSLFTGDFAWSNQQQRTSPSASESKDLQSIKTSSGSSPNLLRSGDAQLSSMFAKVGSGYNSSDHCLLLLDLRNAWPNPLSISLEVDESVGGSDQFSSTGKHVVTEDLQPGHISRFVLILPRVYLDNPHAAIPSLNTGSKRQFVVSANKLTFEAEAADREAFWFREELLKRVHGTWVEHATGRKGGIELRGIRLAPRMVDAIRLESFDISFSIGSHRQQKDKSNEEEAVTQTGRSKFSIKTSSFLYLTVSIHNRSSKPIYPLLRLQPSLRNQPHNIALDLTRRLICTGMLQHVLPILGPHETTESTIGITALCRGDYEIGASVEEVKLLKAPAPAPPDDDKVESKRQSRSYNDMIEDAFDSSMKKERRVWHAREPCIISAED
ncbi:hypothetical protein FQN54_008626 [Arachnomyces sp. PD_36]|nr:hypothetical protein FQN54_008626 [Arachnomyces sp. PD_36]